MDLRKQAPTITAVCLTVLTLLAIGAALSWLRPVLVPFVLAVFLSIVASPVVDFLRTRLRLPQGIAIVATLLLGLAMLVALSVVVASALAELRDDEATYVAQLDDMRQRLEESAQPLLRLLHLDTDSDWVEPLTNQDRLTGLLRGLLNEVLGIASDGAVVLIYLFFLLASHSSLDPNPSGTWSRVRNSIAQYMSLKILVSFVTAALVWATLEYFGVPLALVFGLLTFALNFIPNVGSLIALVLPIPVILMNPVLTPAAKTLAIAIPAVVQFLVGNVVEPRLMGRSLDLHPVVVLLGLIVWGWLWGIVGVLLAVPMTSAMKIVFEQLGYTRPLAEVLAGRPSSTPPTGSP